jgi:hypothetical protein
MWEEKWQALCELALIRIVQVLRKFLQRFRVLKICGKSNISPKFNQNEPKYENKGYRMLGQDGIP